MRWWPKCLQGYVTAYFRVHEDTATGMSSHESAAVGCWDPCNADQPGCIASHICGEDDWPQRPAVLPWGLHLSTQLDHHNCTHNHVWFKASLFQEL